jgi:hypothetical protein
MPLGPNQMNKSTRQIGSYANVVIAIIVGFIGLIAVVLMATTENVLTVIVALQYGNFVVLLAIMYLLLGRR